LKIGTAVALGAVLGLALGILVSVITDVPLAPELERAQDEDRVADASRA
jgi:hypothetical protein